MKILITGASGFLGKNLLLSLDEDWEVTAIYHSNKLFKQFLIDKNLNQIMAFQINLLDRHAIRQFATTHQKYFDACIYFAANGDPALSVRKPGYDLQTNSKALINLLEEIQVGKFIYFSSGAVYDGLKGYVNPSSKTDPTLPYAISKYASERYVQFFKKLGKIKVFCNIRFFGAYGPYEPERKIFSRLVRQFGINQLADYKIIGDGKNYIDAMYITDTIEAIHLLIHDDKPPLLVDLYSNSPTTITELVESAGKIFGIKPAIEFTGNVSEYIEFQSNDQTFFKKYDFAPKVTLEEGLLNLYSHLVGAD